MGYSDMKSDSVVKRYDDSTATVSFRQAVTTAPPEYTAIGWPRKDRFEYQSPTPDQVQRIAAVRMALRYASEVLYANVPMTSDRERACTHLEEVSMWANKAIVFES